jgi:UDP-MurNAc hydroxylase
MVLLTCGDEPAVTKAYKQGTNPDEMTTKAGYEFQRWCPHAGEDLNYARIEDGKITCIRHEWCWDAETGECLTGQKVPLKVRRADV